MILEGREVFRPGNAVFDSLLSIVSTADGIFGISGISAGLAVVGGAVDGILGSGEDVEGVCGLGMSTGFSAIPDNGDAF